jgi:hypothetical protein
MNNLPVQEFDSQSFMVQILWLPGTSAYPFSIRFILCNNENYWVEKFFGKKNLQLRNVQTQNPGPHS